MIVPPIGTMHGNLRKAKDSYCSSPSWLPQRVRDYLESNAWWCCKIHDQEVGIAGYGKISLPRAHLNFIWSLLTKSSLPWALRPVIALIALPFIFIRGRGSYDPNSG